MNGHAEKPLRADALRNRERLITTARAAYAAADEPVVIENIARDAGVGIGTLYRHFPTREALVEAVYAAELDDLVASAPALLEAEPADRALRSWMSRYARFAANKRGMVDTLRAAWAAGRIAAPTTRERINGVLGTLLAAGAQDGTLRGDVHPDDVTAMLLGVFVSTSGNTTDDQTGRLLDLIVDALRPS